MGIDYERDLFDPNLGSTMLTGSFVDPTPVNPAGGLLRQTKWMSNLGLFTTVLGGINSAIGSFYAAKSAQYQAKSQAMGLEFASDMAALNARSAENEAQSTLEAGKGEVMRYTMRAGQEKAAVTNQMAGRGVALGVGSARDVSASQDIVKDLDVLTINSNATRQAWAARTQATNYRNQALLDRVSANNARLSADSISPTGAAMTSLLGSASTIASSWNWQRQLRKLTGTNDPYYAMASMFAGRG